MKNRFNIFTILTAIHMRPLLFILSFVLFTNTLFAQTEPASYKQVADKVVEYYNQASYESIFAMFSTDMQNALPLEKTQAFFSGLAAQAGKITQKEFHEMENSYATYKTVFEKTVLALKISVDDNEKINGILFKPFKTTSANAKATRSKTKLILPFNEAWFVGWGGDTKELNYHVESQSQKNAFDLLIIDKDSNTHKADGKKNEDYYVFGKNIIAPCDGKVVLVVDGVKENIPGEMNSFNVGGNTVIIQTVNNEYLVFCHLKHQSIKVKEGQTVKQGQLLGLCGNTGHSSEPHLHFHIQDKEDMSSATGIKCYFDNILVNGNLKTDYSPIKNEVIKNK